MNQRVHQDVEKIFLYSITGMLTLAAVILAVAEDAAFPSMLTPIVAIFSLRMIDRPQKRGLSIWWANALGIVAFTVAAGEFSGGTPLTKLIAGAHLLIYITWVVLLLRKGIRQFWWLCALAMLQVSVASVLTAEATFGIWLVSMLLIMVWTMSVFSLYRTRRRLSRELDGVEDSLDTESAAHSDRRSFVMVRNGVQLEPSQKWLDWKFRGVVSITFVASLFVAAITFFVFPRVWVPGTGLADLAEEIEEEGFLNQTGFTDEVQLGDIGQIMQSNQRVLQFSIKRLRDSAEVSPEQFVNQMGMDEILLRGTCLGIYNNGRWTNKRNNTVLQERSVRFDSDNSQSDFEVTIIQDPPIAKYAFLPLPASRYWYDNDNIRPYQARNGFYGIHQFVNTNYRSAGYDPARNQSLKYTVWCQRPLKQQKRHMPKKRSVTNNSQTRLVQEIDRTTGQRSFQLRPNNLDIEHRQYAAYWSLTPNLRRDLPQLADLAFNLCVNSQGQQLPTRDCIQKVFAFLNTSGQFAYSLKLEVQDKSIDPIEDFVLNTKTGHCEYFASACALMLQSVNIPARVVNGYKGYQTNEVSGIHEVGQRHAHTWVEVFVDGNWETVDPTPASARSADVKAEQSSLVADLGRAIRDNWESLFTRMSLQRQEAMVKPILDRIKAIFQVIKDKGLIESLKILYREYILQPHKWVSWKTGVFTFVFLWIVAFLFKARPIRWLLGKLNSGLGLFNSESRQQRNIVRFYENFRTTCERHGLSLHESQTAVEHASNAIQHFSDRLTAESDRQLPIRIARAFNQVRFGAKELSTDVVQTVRDDVTRFSELISA